MRLAGESLCFMSGLAALALAGPQPGISEVQLQSWVSDECMYACISMQVLGADRAHTSTQYSILIPINFTKYSFRCINYANWISHNLNACI